MIIIQIISGSITILMGIFYLVFNIALPLMEIYFDYNNYGVSMEPTLTNHVDIRLCPELVPYEELRVGDIIVFRQEDGPPGRTFLPEWNDEHNKYQFIPKTEQEEAKKYIRVIHRVISINKNGLITKGDNNEFVDFFPVMADDYQGKIIWHMNHIDWLFKGLYRYGIWTVSLFVFIYSSINLRKGRYCLNKT